MVRLKPDTTENQATHGPAEAGHYRKIEQPTVRLKPDTTFEQPTVRLKLGATYDAASPVKTPMIRTMIARVTRILGARSALVGRAPREDATMGRR